ncbi:TRP-like ion channel Pkd2, partial [Cymbomonas tetramitiformis]
MPVVMRGTTVAKTLDSGRFTAEVELKEEVPNRRRRPSRELLVEGDRDDSGPLNEPFKDKGEWVEEEGGDRELKRQRVLEDVHARCQKIRKDKADYVSLFSFLLFTAIYLNVLVSQRNAQVAFGVHKISQTLLITDSNTGNVINPITSWGQVISWLNSTFIQAIWTDPSCGDTKCSLPQEFPAWGRFGCQADCGLEENVTHLRVWIEHPYTNQDAIDEGNEHVYFTWDMCNENGLCWFEADEHPTINLGEHSSVDLRVVDGTWTLYLTEHYDSSPNPVGGARGVIYQYDADDQNRRQILHFEPTPCHTSNGTSIEDDDWNEICPNGFDNSSVGVTTDMPMYPNECYSDAIEWHDDEDALDICDTEQRPSCPYAHEDCDEDRELSFDVVYCGMNATLVSEACAENSSSVFEYVACGCNLAPLLNCALDQAYKQYGPCCSDTCLPTCMDLDNATCAYFTGVTDKCLASLDKFQGYEGYEYHGFPQCGNILGNPKSDEGWPMCDTGGKGNGCDNDKCWRDGMMCCYETATSGGETDQVWVYEPRSGITECMERVYGDRTFEVTIKQFDEIEEDYVERRTIGEHNIIIGGLVLHQVRSAAVANPDHRFAHLYNKIPDGESDASPHGDDAFFVSTSSLYDDNLDALDWYTAEEIADGLHGVPPGFFSYSLPGYHIDGFPVVFDINLNNSMATMYLTYLQDGVFFDSLTKEVNVELATYNGIERLFCIIGFKFQLLPSGIIKLDTSINPLNVENYSKTSDKVRAAFELLCCIFVVASIYAECKTIAEIYKTTGKVSLYFRWNLLYVISICFNVLAIVLWVLFVTNGGNFSVDI